MVKKSGTHTNVFEPDEPAFSKLATVTAKIRAIAYLIGQQKAREASPNDEEEICFGIEELLSQLAEEIKVVSKELGEEER